MVVIGTVKRSFNYGPGFRGQFPLELYSETTFEQMQEPAVLVINGTLQFDLPYIRQHRATQPEPQQGTDALCADLPTMDELQRRYIKHVLTVTRGKIDGETGALRILGMKRSTLYRKIKEFGLDRQTQLYGTRSDDRS